MESLRVLELYSGIGGMHYALKGLNVMFEDQQRTLLWKAGQSSCIQILPSDCEIMQFNLILERQAVLRKFYLHIGLVIHIAQLPEPKPEPQPPHVEQEANTESGIPVQVVAAIDINTTANEIYKHNFPDTPLWNKTIEGITLSDFNKLSFDMILMSPPCQPFTRIGLQRDIADPRTKSLLHILDLLPRLSRLPRFILLENVKGFENSSARDHLVKTLMECGYTIQEFMVSPTSVGIPNSRLRYYLIAKISTEKISDAFPHPAESDSVEEPSVSSSLGPVTCLPEEEIHGGEALYKLETAKDAQRKINQNNDLSVRQIQDFMEPQMEVNMEHYLLPPKTLLRYAMLLDIVRPTCRRSVCFTKGYGRYVEGTGSVLQCCMETEMESVFRGLDQCSEEEKLQMLLKLKLRYFTPREVANLMGFPKSFSFPEHIPTKHQYKVLGNSLNVVVVAKLIQQLVS